MSTLAKKAVFITILIVAPMIATDILLNNLQIAELGKEVQFLIMAVAVSAIIIFSFLWTKNMKKNRHI